MYNKVADIYCKDPNLLLSVFNEMVESGMNEEEALSRLYAFCPTKRAALYLRSVLPIPENNILICSETRNSKDPSDSKEIEKYIKWIKTFDMKFDYIIQNPPYNGNLHLDFLEKGLDLLTPGNGRMVIIEPSTPYINIRKSGSGANRYTAIKDKIDGHVESVKIENLNKEFGTGQYVPFATTVIDMSKEFDYIEFSCCGETKRVKSIYDCNLIGDYDTIWSILTKISNFGDMVKSHTTTTNMGGDYCYIKYDKNLPNGNIEPATGNKNIGTSGSFSREVNYIKILGKDYLYKYVQSCYNRFVKITESVPKKLKGGSTYEKPVYSEENADCIYGKREELENWEYFIFNNKLPLFINIVMTIHQQNVVTGWLPWLVDKQYTDEEINEMFGFTDEEIVLIDRTIKKYERNSPWFKRYMCGPDSVSDEEVNNFINNL